MKRSKYRRVLLYNRLIEKRLVIMVREATASHSAPDRWLSDRPFVVDQITRIALSLLGSPSKTILLTGGFSSHNSITFHWILLLFTYCCQVPDNLSSFAHPLQTLTGVLK